MPPLRDPDIRAQILALLSAPEDEDRVDWSPSARRGLLEVFQGRLTQRRVNQFIRAWVANPELRVNAVAEVMEQYRHQGDRYEIRFAIGPPRKRVFLYFYITADFGHDILRVAQFKLDRDHPQ